MSVAVFTVVGFGMLLQIDLLWYIPLAQAVAPILVIFLGGLAVGAALTKRWAAVVILVVGTLLGAWPLLIPAEEDSGPGDGGPVVNILSLNIQYSGADEAAVAKLLTDEDVQIAVLLECNDAYVDSLAATGGLAHLPYTLGGTPEVSAAGTCIFSAWPLREPGDVADGRAGGEFYQPTAVVTIPGMGDVQIAAVHPAPPLGGAEAWHDGLSTIGLWQRTHKDLPLILAGDFNASTAHPMYRDAVSGLTDTAVANTPGWFPLPTWPSGGRVPPFTAIDHILVRDLHPVAWQRVTIPGTDHMGILAGVTTSG